MRKPLNTKILKAYRTEAYARLNFYGTSSGYWETVIDGILYTSERVNAFKVSFNSCRWFLRNAILDRVSIRRNPDKYHSILAKCIHGCSRVVYENGTVIQCFAVSDSYK